MCVQLAFLPVSPKSEDSLFVALSFRVPLACPLSLLQTLPPSCRSSQTTRSFSPPTGPARASSPPPAFTTAWRSERNSRRHFLCLRLSVSRVLCWEPFLFSSSLFSPFYFSISIFIIFHCLLIFHSSPSSSMPDSQTRVGTGE